MPQETPIARGSRDLFVSRAATVAPARRQWWHDAFLVCAKCATGTLAGHIATCVVGVPVVSALFSSAATSIAAADSVISSVVPFACAWGITGYWFYKKGRDSHVAYKILNAATATAIAVSLIPATPSGRWTHDNVVNPLHAEALFWMQSAEDRETVRIMARAGGLTPHEYMRINYCKSWGGPN